MAERRSYRATRPLAAALAALALAGCAADHVGDDWQCPLAQGKVCASVAVADPAVPETFVPETRGTARSVGDIPPDRRIDEPACESDCDPLAWLAGLFAGPADTGPDAAAQDDDIDGLGTAASPRNAAAAAADTSVGPAETLAADAPGAARDAADPSGHQASRASGVDSPTIASAAPDGSPLPAAGEMADPGTDDVAGEAADALRTGEVVARIWIAPFVDADGIYREGSWVRAVIAPAAWRLP